MGQLATTLYFPGTMTVQMTVSLPVQGQVYAIAVLAAESDLLNLAIAAGRTDWNTSDCCTFASNVIGIPVTP